MIKANKEEVKINGTIGEVKSEFAATAGAIYHVLTRNGMTSDEAKEDITRLVDTGILVETIENGMSAKEYDTPIAKILKDMLKEVLKGEKDDE